MICTYGSVYLFHCLSIIIWNVAPCFRMLLYQCTSMHIREDMNQKRGYSSRIEAIWRNVRERARPPSRRPLATSRVRKRLSFQWLKDMDCPRCESLSSWD
ncbi:hypothetical protein BDV24DRAFT_146056 [Aspergillus arachidicola]|uniref:Uncharacterized protein n=1 Tax=Aspergillus arachidicola TaxID=656916 RepID=A0A5N6XM42_9EURO|nr:hypothetical protein BDV24DRAFT_146056 [Aspergillus arachidicola]